MNDIYHGTILIIRNFGGILKDYQCTYNDNDINKRMTWELNYLTYQEHLIYFLVRYIKKERMFFFLI